MSAAEKLRALDAAVPAAPWTELRMWTDRPASEAARWTVILRNALPAIIAVVEGYQRAGIVGCAGIGCSCERCTALATLSQALEPGDA